MISWSLLLHFLLLKKVASDEYKTVTSVRSGKGDDDKAIAKCPSGYYLIKCRIVSGSKRDGVTIPEDLSHSCIAQNAATGNGVVVSCSILQIQ